MATLIRWLFGPPKLPDPVEFYTLLCGCKVIINPSDVGDEYLGCYCMEASHDED